jgi:alkanesulfonate monooxygenase SsuD/methylene tetrahydromethanopterin reductase-like flavin-dependent oxidoreductase (luciferase family)
MSPIETRAELAESVEQYREELDNVGRAYEEIRRPLRREVYVAEDDNTAWEEVGPSLLYEYEDVYGDYDDIEHSFRSDSAGEDAIESLRKHAEDRFIIGSPETAIEEIEAYQNTIGMDEVIMRMHFPGLDPDKSRKSMHLIAEDVMPHFQS